MQTRIMQILVSAPHTTSRKISKLLGLPDAQVRDALKTLRTSGHVAKVTEAKTTYYSATVFGREQVESDAVAAEHEAHTANDMRQFETPDDGLTDAERADYVRHCDAHHDPDPTAEDYPGQHITGPETVSVPIVTPAAAVLPVVGTPSLKDTVDGINEAGWDKAMATVKPVYVLKTLDGYLRRYQPTKTQPTQYKTVALDRATTYVRLEQAEIKVAEAKTLGITAWAVAL